LQKINAANSWNLALIDYFYDMNILREGDSINFQKASCTLDGCVKIYTSRVDSVATETGKLLSGLADTTTDKDDYNRDGEDGAEDGAPARKKVCVAGDVRSLQANFVWPIKISRTVKTLLEDFSSLNTKKFDLDFTVDPLFKKTCADFDEGGARGLLLNHLSIANHGMIIFDAGDAIAGDEDAEIVAEETEEAAMDLQKLIGKYGSSSKRQVNLADKFGDSVPHKLPLQGQDISERRICPSLEQFSFESSGTDNMLQAAAIAFDNHTEDDIDDLGGDLDPGLLDNDAVYAHSDDGGMDDGDHQGMLDDYANNDGAFGGAEETEMAWTDALSMPMFDEKVLRNWAGPEHWRLRPIKGMCLALTDRLSTI